MPYPAAAIANKFLDLAKLDNTPLTPMQIQKLVYFSHGWHLAFDQGPLSSEHAQAWQWGPVFPELYHALKRWGGGSIDEPISVTDPAYGGGKHRHESTTPIIQETGSFSLQLIDRVWRVYGHMSGPALSQLSHDPAGPWYLMRTESQDARGIDIPNSIICDYFKAKLRANTAA